MEPPFSRERLRAMRDEIAAAARDEALECVVAGIKNAIVDIAAGGHGQGGHFGAPCVRKVGDTRACITYNQIAFAGLPGDGRRGGGGGARGVGVHPAAAAVLQQLEQQFRELQAHGGRAPPGQQQHTPQHTLLGVHAAPAVPGPVSGMPFGFGGGGAIRGGDGGGSDGGAKLLAAVVARVKAMFPDCAFTEDPLATYLLVDWAPDALAPAPAGAGAGAGAGAQ